MNQQLDDKQLHREAIIIDATAPLGNIDHYFEQWVQGGVTVMAPSIAIDQDDCEKTINNIASWNKRFEEHADRITPIQTVEDIYRAKEQGKLGILFHFQSTCPIDKNIELLSVYHQLGVRMIMLCYNAKNFIGDGCAERTDSGLSDFGIRVIAEMNRLGILVDLSHTGYTTTMEAIEVSRKPVVFSHSNVYAVCPSPRNIKDDQIKAVANKGGVIGINGFPHFLAKKDRPTIDDLIDHIEYICKLVGVEHVGIALDYWEGMAGVASPEQAQKQYDVFRKSGAWKEDTYPAPPYWYPKDLEQPAKFPNLTQALVRRGFSKEHIQLILGENFLRVFKEVWV